MDTIGFQGGCHATYVSAIGNLPKKVHRFKAKAVTCGKCATRACSPKRNAIKIQHHDAMSVGGVKCKNIRRRVVMWCRK